MSLQNDSSVISGSETNINMTQKNFRFTNCLVICVVRDAKRWHIFLHKDACSKSSVYHTYAITHHNELSDIINLYY